MYITTLDHTCVMNSESCIIIIIIHSETCIVYVSCTRILNTIYSRYYTSTSFDVSRPDGRHGRQTEEVRAFGLI